jgi:hypothetical protein
MDSAGFGRERYRALVRGLGSIASDSVRHRQPDLASPVIARSRRVRYRYQCRHVSMRRH